MSCKKCVRLAGDLCVPETPPRGCSHCSSITLSLSLINQYRELSMRKRPRVCLLLLGALFEPGGGEQAVLMENRAATPASSAQHPATITPTPMAAVVGEAASPPAGAMAGGMTTPEQLKQAEAYLATLHGDRDESCRELELEANLFLESPSTPEQERRFRLIYQLVRYQVRFQKLLLVISFEKGASFVQIGFSFVRRGRRRQQQTDLCVWNAECVWNAVHIVSARVAIVFHTLFMSTGMHRYGCSTLRKEG